MRVFKRSRAAGWTCVRTLCLGCLFLLAACRAQREHGPPAHLEWVGATLTGALPPRLTGTDGEGLQLVSIEAQVIVQEPLAFTELHLRFRNPELRLREGTFEITLPPSAALSRFAMRIGEKFQEGEVVERQKARQTYENFLHRKQDPALLEQDAGNHFSARVFPIAPREEKEIILSYSEQLNVGDAYRLHLAGLPTLEKLDVRVLASDGSHEIKDHRGAIPGDLVLTGSRGVRSADLALRANGLYLARVTPTLQSKPAEVDALTVLFDTSASGAQTFDARAERMVRLVEQLSVAIRKDIAVKLVAFDQEVAPLFAGSASRMASEGLPALRKRRALGASNLSLALTELSKEKLGPRLLLVSDAVVTAGDTSVEALVSPLQKLHEQGVVRLDVLLTGANHDRALAKRLVTMGFLRPGVILGDGEDDESMLSKLTRQPEGSLPIRVSGAHWWWPQRVSSLLPGQSVIVVASLKDTQTPEVSVGLGKPVRPEPIPVFEPLLQRAWALAKVTDLERRLNELDANDSAERGTLEAELISTSMRYRVLSSSTALLVLETEQDYTRFGIDRLALNDILTVGAEGMALLDGRAPQQIAGASDGSVPLRSTNAGISKAAPGLAVTPHLPVPMATGRTDLLRRHTSSFRPSPFSNAPSRAQSDIGDLLSGSLGMRAGAARPAPPAALPPPAPGTYPARAMTVVERLEGTRNIRPVEQALALRQRELERCYEPELRTTPELSSRLGFHVYVARAGKVRRAEFNWGSMSSYALQQCTLRWLRSLQFEPHRGDAKYYVEVRYAAKQNVNFAMRTLLKRAAPETAEPPKDNLDAALEGPLLSVLNAIQGGSVQAALREAWRYRAQEPESVLALVALGQALAASDDPATAARAYGSIIDLSPSHADMRRAAGNYLDSLKSASARALALDSYAKAREQRPDHPNSHRLYGYALAKAGRYVEAFQVLREGRVRSYPDARFPGVEGVLDEDLRVVSSAWQRADPGAAPRIEGLMQKLQLVAQTTPSLRVVLSWETDTNDVDLHIYDGQRGHSYYGLPELASGGNLGSDVVQGYGPEHFTVAAPLAFPYQLAVQYYARGVMGMAMGKLQIIHHDGKGNLNFDERPFVLMKDRAHLSLGTIERDVIVANAQTQAP